MNPLSRSFVFLAMLALATPASAGLNSGATATASWSPDAFVYKADCAPVNTVYITFKRSGGLTFAGGDFRALWTFGLPAPVRHDPGGATSGCITYVQSLFPHSTTCEALNRGGSAVQLEDTYSDESGGYAHLSWINSLTSTGCDSGLVLEVQIESDMCVHCGAGVYSDFSYVYDGTDWDYCPGNVWLTLGDGPTFPVLPTTWGAIKDLERH